MIDIQEITRKIIEEKENIIAKAFTVQIGELLKENGIVPVMTEYTKRDIDNITDASEYKLVTTVGVAFKELDTSEHDAKVRADAIDEFAKDIVDKINFEEKWLFCCKSNNADTNIAFGALKTFVDSRAKQLKEK